MDIIAPLSSVFLAVVGIVNFIISIAVFRSNSKSATNRIFVLLGLTITVWLIVQSSSLKPASPELVLLLIKLSNFFAAPICALFLLLSHTIPATTLKLRGKRLVLLVSMTIVVMAVSLTPLTFSTVDVTGPTPVPTPGPGLLLFMIFVITCSTSISVVLYKRLRHSVGLVKQQLFFLMIGIGAMLGLIISTIIIPVLVFRNSSFVPLFPVYTLCFTGATGYSIVKHRLFDIKVIATEVFSITLWSLLFIKLIVNPAGTISWVIDLLVFLFSVFFGVLLVKSVRVEVEQKEKLAILTKALQALDSKKDEFINMAAHELRAPLTAIKGFLSMVIGGDAGEISPQAKGFLDDSAVSTERMIRLVNNMLNVSRIEEGRMMYQNEDLHLVTTAESVYNEFKVESERKNLQFSLHKDNNIQDLVFGDEDKLHEVIVNFVSNAIKYTEKGSVTIKLSNPNSSRIRLEIIDTGAGISKEEQKKLFQKFYRVESKVGKTIGTGLGLYISKLLIEKFGGSIGVISKEMEGSTFWFELPIKNEGRV